MHFNELRNVEASRSLLLSVVTWIFTERAKESLQAIEIN